MQSVMPLSPRAPKTILTKILIDQLGFAPLCTCIFFAYQTMVQSKFRWALGKRAFLVVVVAVTLATA